LRSIMWNSIYLPQADKARHLQGVIHRPLISHFFGPPRKPEFAGAMALCCRAKSDVFGGCDWGGSKVSSTFLQLRPSSRIHSRRRDARGPTTLSIYLSCTRAAGIDQNRKRRSGTGTAIYKGSGSPRPPVHLNLSTLPGSPHPPPQLAFDGDHHAQGRPGTADDGETRISLLCLSAELRPRAWRPAHGPHSAVHVSTTSADLDRPANSRVPRPAAQTEGVLLLLLRVLLRALTYPFSCARRLRASAPWLSVDLKVR
jgi:hypothetical protein